MTDFLGSLKSPTGSSLPASGEAGDLFFKTGVGLYCHDGSEWVALGGGSGGEDGGGAIIGEEKMWPGISLPSVEGETFMWENGAAISRTTYKTLFERLAISTTGNRTSGSKVLKSIPSTTGMKVGMPVSGTGVKAATTIETVNSSTEITLSQAASSTGSGGAFVVAPHGVGNGSTTFNLPDARGRVATAPDDMGGIDAGRISTEPQELGGSGGEERHTLSEAEMPSHSHNLNGGWGAGTGFLPQLALNQTLFQTGGMMQNAGSSVSHNNMQPFRNTNMIIRVA